MRVDFVPRRQELRVKGLDAVRVTAVSPGLVETDFSAGESQLVFKVYDYPKP